jgi:hypothetical protein
VVALGQQPHDLGVIGPLDRVKAIRAQGGDGNGEGIVGIVLLRTARAEHPDPRGQRGWDVEHHFAGIDELSGQQITETTGGLDGPGALGEGLGPRQQLGRLLACRPDRDLGHFAFITTNSHRRVARLVGIDPDDHRHEHLLLG